MIYIYDIQLNWFEDEVYDFFEWNEKDNFQQVKKIPLFKLEEKAFRDLYYNKVKVEKEFILVIKNKTELFDKNVNNIGNCVLITNGVKAIAIKFDDNGTLLAKSKMLIDEEDEIALLSFKLGYTKLNYQVLKIKDENSYLTRKEAQIKKELQIILNSSYQKRCKDEIKYIYYEMFDNILDDIDIMYKQTKEKISKKIDDKCIQVYNTLSLNRRINI